MQLKTKENGEMIKYKEKLWHISNEKNFNTEIFVLKLIYG